MLRRKLVFAFNEHVWLLSSEYIVYSSMGSLCAKQVSQLCKPKRAHSKRITSMCELFTSTSFTERTTLSLCQDLPNFFAPHWTIYVPRALQSTSTRISVNVVIEHIFCFVKLFACANPFNPIILDLALMLSEWWLNGGCLLLTCRYRALVNMTMTMMNGDNDTCAIPPIIDERVKKV